MPALTANAVAQPVVDVLPVVVVSLARNGLQFKICKSASTANTIREYERTSVT